MSISKKKMIAIIFLVSLTLTACIQQELSTTDEWIGQYSHSGKTPQGDYIHMNLLIYADEEGYFGYLGLEGFGSMLLEAQGNEDMLFLYFKENITENNGRHKLLEGYQTGDLLFSLKREEDELTTTWQGMLPDEIEEDLLRGFYYGEEKLSVVLMDEKERAHFLRAKGISEQESPFYQYYNEDGDLQLDFYLGRAQDGGTCILYNKFNGIRTMCGFETENFMTGTYEEDDFFAETGKEDDLQPENYEEEHKYNEQGKLTYFCSYGIMTDDGRPVREKLVEIESSYRQDGTLQKQERYFNSRLWGTTRSTGKYYYDEMERLEYVDSYITHGYLEDYYIYEGDSRKPKYYLALDHMGGQVWVLDFIKYY